MDMMTPVEIRAYRKLKRRGSLKSPMFSVSDTQALNRLVKKGLVIKTDSGWKIKGEI